MLGNREASEQQGSSPMFGSKFNCVGVHWLAYRSDTLSHAFCVTAAGVVLLENSIPYSGDTVALFTAVALTETTLIKRIRC